PTMMGQAPTIPPPVTPAIPAPFAAPAPAPIAARPPTPQPMAYAPPPGFDPSAVEVQDGSRAIEVAAMFEDSVVEVRHLSDPSAGQVTGLTKGLLGGGSLALAIAFITFVVAYVQQAALSAQWEAWDAAGKPHNEFLATLPGGGREGPGLDILVSVCMIFGLYA